MARLRQQRLRRDRSRFQKRQKLCSFKSGGRTMSRVIHFEIPASDPERASAFYKKVFGWKIEKWPGPMEYWMVTTGGDGSPGVKGGPIKNTDVKKNTNNNGEDSGYPSLETGTKAGGKLGLPKTAIPNVG